MTHSETTPQTPPAKTELIEMLRNGLMARLDDLPLRAKTVDFKWEKNTAKMLIKEIDDIITAHKKFGIRSDKELGKFLKEKGYDSLYQLLYTKL